MDVPGNDSLIEGNATLTMVASRNAKKAPEDATSRTLEAGTRARRPADIVTASMRHRMPRAKFGPASRAATTIVTTRLVRTGSACSKLSSQARPHAEPQGSSPFWACRSGLSLRA